MMLKVGSEDLEFNVEPEVERQVKIFEDLSDSAGDFSYEFEIDLTSHNIRVLQFPFPDNLSKNVYHKINCELISDEGESIYSGFLRIERILGYVASTSFFSGNNNWFGLLSGPLSDIDFSDLEVDQTESNIVSSWTQDEGLVFPLVDNGGLTTRGAANLKIEDFVPAIYVHTIIKRIFRNQSIKLTGELFTDPNYKRLIIMKSPSDEVESRSSYVGKTITQTVGSPRVPLTFDDDSNRPFFDGSQNNFNLATSQYIADVKMRVTVEVSINCSGPLSHVFLSLARNGVGFDYVGETLGSADETITIKSEVTLNPGDILEVAVEDTITTVDITSGFIRVTPTYLYVAFGDSSLPDWTQQEFVANIFSIFNVIPSYDSKSKVLTVNLFEKVKSKEAIDISEYVSSVETDYSEFISNYGKRSLALYNEVKFNDWNQLGINNFFPSGNGEILIDNDFLSDTETIIDNEFSNPQSYVNSVFDMSIERMENIKLESVEDTSGTSASASGDIVRFSVSDDIFEVGDLVRIEESTVAQYNGDWIVAAVGSGYIDIQDLSFDVSATAVISLMKYMYSDNDDVFLMFNVPNYSFSNISSRSDFKINTSVKTSVAFGYFNIIDNGRPVSTDFIQSLSFGEVDSPYFYQRTILETYWNLASRILNDPAMERVTVNLPYSVFHAINFLGPIEIRTLETANKYYPNRITGYQGSEHDAIIELIKLP